MTASVAQDVAMMGIELEELRQKSLDDDRLVTVLKELNANLTKELDACKVRYMTETNALRRERDEALQRSGDVLSIITGIGRLALAGANRMAKKDPADALDAVENALQGLGAATPAAVLPEVEVVEEEIPFAPRRPHRAFVDDDRLPPLAFLEPKPSEFPAPQVEGLDHLDGMVRRLVSRRG